jgi:hypothetical protein
MRKVIVIEYVSLDGVIRRPGMRTRIPKVGSHTAGGTGA